MKEIINHYKNVDSYVWAQEEPRNMGAWSHMAQRFELVNLEVASLPYYAVPAAGSTARFKIRHEQVIDKVFE